MRYELLLQPVGRDQAFDAAAAERAMDARGARVDGQVEVAPLVESGKTVALMLRVPLGERTEGIGEILRAALEVARACSLQVVDPQLSRAVSESDEGALIEQFLRTARYAGEMMGLPEAIGASFAPEPTGLGPGTKVLLGLISLAVLLYLAVDEISARL